jgi:hypothetical protein
MFLLHNGETLLAPQTRCLCYGARVEVDALFGDSF